MKDQLLRSLMTLFVGIALLLPVRAQAAVVVSPQAPTSCNVQVTGASCLGDNSQLNVSWNSGGG